MSHPLKIFLIAGEASGDVLGGKLMTALNHAATQRGDEIIFDGIGGEHMIKAGLAKSRFAMRELSLIGIAEILPHLPRLLRRIKETTKHIQHQKPDILLTIDAPAFGLRVASKLGKTDHTLRVHFVAPQHWAWRPGRARALKHETDLMLALLPFEPEFFNQYGVACDYVGHPVIESYPQQPGDGEQFRRSHAIADPQKIIILLPGSRRNEFIRLVPQFTAALQLLAKNWPPHEPPPVVILPLAAASQNLYHHDPQWKNMLAALPWRVIALAADDEQAKWEAFAAAATKGAALAASGTVTLELALAGLPSVIAYRVSWLTFMLFKLLARIPHVGLANIIAGREIMPEYLQSRCRPDLLAAALAPLLQDSAARQSQTDGLRKVAAALQGEACEKTKPSQRAAAKILAAWQQRQTQKNQ
ncbi:MAG: lipid-A-disaccharide synthase [Candidatus Symbiobacter sp.]|nr:lipid-A-disaccharide synthase [Candidatus Symbiobacter sp.]